MSELPEDIRIPLHSLQADMGYLFGRVAADGSCAGAMAESVKERLTAIESAVSRRSTAVGSTPSEGEPDCHGEGHDHQSHDWRQACLKCGVFRGSDLYTRPAQGMEVMSELLELRAAAQVRANSEGDGGAVKVKPLAADAQAAALAASPAQEVVAWRIEFSDGSYDLAFTEDDACDRIAETHDVNAKWAPLYASPPSQALRGKVEEENSALSSIETGGKP